MPQKWNKAEDVLWPLTRRGVEAINYNFDQIFLALRVSPLGKGVLPVVNGGTNTNAFTAGDVLYASDAEHVVGLHDIATGNVLISGGIGAAPSYGKVQLAGPPQHVTGTLPASNGGTGISSYTIGDLLYASGAAALSKLSDVATGNALISGGVAAAPSWGKIGLTTHVSGILPPANGGTGFATYTVGDILYADTTASLAKLSDVATGNALISGGVSTAPSWGKIGLTTHVSGILPPANGGTGFATYAVGDLLYADTTSSLAKLADVATGNALISGGLSTAPAWGKVGLTTHVSGVLAPTNGGTGLSSYSQGDILYASAANTLAALAKDTNATRYLSNTGASNAPAWAQVNLTNGVTGLLPIANGGTGSGTASGARTALGLGTMAVQDANNVAITGGSIFGQSGFQVTGASSASGGAGLEFVYSAPFGIMQAYDRTNAVYKSIVLSGTDLTIQLHTGGGGGTNSTTWASDGTLNHTNALRLSGTISPSALASGLTHNYNPTSFHTTFGVRLTPDASNSTITGFDPGTDGETHRIFNIATGGGGKVFLSPNDTGSSATGRMLIDSNYSTISPFPINPGASVDIQYDGTSARWRVISAR